MKYQRLTIEFPTVSAVPQKKTAARMAVRNGGWKGRRAYEISGKDPITDVPDINLDRVDEALFALGLGVVDEFMAAGFGERDAWQAASAAVDAAVARLDKVADRLIGGRA